MRQRIINLTSKSTYLTEFFRATLFTIQLGSNTLTEDDPNRVTVATSEYALHPEFNPTTLENDVGLIKLRLPVEFTSA